MKITSLDALDVRFPTSDEAHGSDAMHTDPDYSAAYVVLHTDDAYRGYGFTFTLGRGTEVCISAIRALESVVVGRDTSALFSDMAGLARALTSEPQLRWLGPEVGAIQLAAGAIQNAVWDLYARTRGVPVWELLAGMSAEEIVGLVDFRWIDDAITPAEALDLLRRAEPGRAKRRAELEHDGYPAYVTSAGWSGYPDEQVRALCREALADGFDHLKMKVGLGAARDRERAALIREEIGSTRRLSMDANQVWSVSEAIEQMRGLAEFDPWWIEEPTSPHDVLGHAAIARALAPIAVATGEHCSNRVVFKQLLQSEAISFCQLDVCRLGGLSEVIAVVLLAAKFGVPVCPHAGGVGLCEYVQHVAWFDYIAVSADLDRRSTEFANHLHEHFTDPVVVENGRYRVPRSPGFSAEMKQESVDEFAFPDGPVWSARRG